MSSVASDCDYQTIPESGRQRPVWAVPLSKEALFRIQLSLSSRRSSVMVLETVCRIFLGSVPSSSTAVRTELDPSDTKWSYQTTGVPGLLVEYRDVKNMSLFSLKLVVVELESGLCTWEGKFGTAANYQVFAEDFHTFWMPDLGQVGIEFGDLSEAERMRVLLREWLERLQTSFTLMAQQEADNLSRKKKKKVPVERQDSQPRLNKKQISTPCNFIHVSGITMTRTEECEKELQGTVRRFFRGTIAGLSRTSTLSLSSKIRAKPARLSAASSEGNLSAPLSKLSLPTGATDVRADTKRSESSQSGKEKKYFSLQRRKKGSQDLDPPDISTTPEPLPNSQSEASFTSSPSATDLDNITPNTRRKQIVQSRVITENDDVTREQVRGDLSQRRSSLTQAPERGRAERRKFSAPNLHYRRDPTASDPRHLLRQHSELPSLQSDLMYDSPDTLYPPPYPYPSQPGTIPVLTRSVPYNTNSVPSHNQIPYQNNSAPYPNNTVSYPPKSGPSPVPSSYSSSSVPYTTHSPYISQSAANQQWSNYPPDSALSTNQTVSISNHSIPYPKQSDQFQNGFVQDPNQFTPQTQSHPSLRPTRPFPPSYPSSPSYPTDHIGPSYPPDHIGPSYPPDPIGPSYPPDPRAPSYPPDPRAPSYPPDPMAPSYPPDPRGPSYPPDPRAPSYPPDPMAPSYPPDPRAPSYPPDPRGPSYPPDPRAPSYPPDPRAPSYPPDPMAPSYPPDPRGPSYPPDPNGPSYPPDPMAPSYPPDPHTTGPAYPTGLTYPSEVPFLPTEAGPRSRHGRARMSEKRDLRRLSNSYTSFGHATNQVDV